MRFIKPITFILHGGLGLCLAPQDSSAALIELHQLLVETESISGNENSVTNKLANYLRDRNFTVELPAVPGDNQTLRHNVFAFRENNRQTPILLTSHIDTVPPFYNYFLDTNGYIWGRGANDAKGSVASQIIALLELLDQGQVAEQEVSLLYVVGEETGGDGMKAFNDLGLEWDAVIFGEPTEGKLAASHKGGLSVNMTAHGRTAHSAYPWFGLNAISLLLPPLAALQKVELPGSIYGNTTIALSSIRGGIRSNIVPDLANAQFGVRPAIKDLDEIERRLTEALSEFSHLEYDIRKGYGPIDCDHDIEGFNITRLNYGTDIPFLNGTYKRYLYGPGSISTAHSDHEYITITELQEGVEGYKKLILGALGRS